MAIALVKCALFVLHSTLVVLIRMVIGHIHEIGGEMI